VGRDRRGGKPQEVLALGFGYANSDLGLYFAISIAIQKFPQE
jgi:zinc transporter ZupT